MATIFHSSKPQNPKIGDSCSDENGDVIIYTKNGWEKLRHNPGANHLFSLELEEEHNDGFFDLIEECEKENKINKKCTCGHGNDWEIGHSSWCDKEKV